MLKGDTGRQRLQLNTQGWFHRQIKLSPKLNSVLSGDSLYKAHFSPGLSLILSVFVKPTLNRSDKGSHTPEGSDARNKGFSGNECATKAFCDRIALALHANPYLICFWLCVNSSNDRQINNQ